MYFHNNSVNQDPVNTNHAYFSRHGDLKVSASESEDDQRLGNARREESATGLKIALNQAMWRDGVQRISKEMG